MKRVTTPTLAVYGADDRKVDVPHDSTILRASFHAAGMRDFTMHVYPDAMHTLLATSNGSSAVEPERYGNGYPNVMLEWLRKRGFL
ncbi:MAG TPA: hypothetical protein VK760_16190 [Candidatus Acidoferrales bacterium]|nr:hypothetical protein [Candidatus Acidoferrales bacterium]